MYQISGLLRFPKLFHAFSTKDDGNMANSILGKTYNFDQVVKNRRKFLEKIDTSVDASICMWVMHGDEVKVADREKAAESMRNFDKALRLDGLVTRENRLYLFLNIADCLPIILYDPVKSAVGLAHAGWKGVDLEIVKKAIKKMEAEFGSTPSDVVVGIGPCARAESFVKENPSQKDDLRWSSFLKSVKEDKYEIDLVGFVKKQLTNSGVLVKNIFDSGIDTVKDKRFFSHVREGKLPLKQQGRFACVVGLKV